MQAHCNCQGRAEGLFPLVLSLDSSDIASSVTTAIAIGGFRLACRAGGRTGWGGSSWQLRPGDMHAPLHESLCAHYCFITVATLNQCLHTLVRPPRRGGTALLFLVEGILAPAIKMGRGAHGRECTQSITCLCYIAVKCHESIRVSYPQHRSR